MIAAVDPDCEVVCDPGWGHPTPALTVDWTISLAEPGIESHAVALLPGPDDTVLSVGWRVELPPRIAAITPDGELAWSFESPVGWNVIRSATIDQDEVLYLGYSELDPNSWMPIGMVSAITLDGEHLWTSPTEAGGEPKAIEPSTSGIAVWQPALFGSTLLSFSDAGALDWQTSIAPSTAIAGRPDGTLAHASGSLGITTLTANGVELGTQAIPPFMSLFGLQYTSGDQLAYVGQGVGAGADEDAIIGVQTLLDGPGWQHAFNDGRVACGGRELTRSREAFEAVELLADGTLLVTGTLFYATDGRSLWPYNPMFVARIDASGQLLGVDRGLFQGVVTAPLAGPDNSAYVMLDYLDTPDTPAHHLRKYSYD